MHENYSALGGGGALASMLLGEISPGGVGSGLYGALVVAILTMFVAGLMVGRTPELVGKQIGRTEITLASLALLVMPALCREPGHLVPQRQLLRDVWGPSYGRESNYLRVYANQLRRKLEPDPAAPQHLITEPGRGYRFVP